MLAYQDIPENITEFVGGLSQNNTLAELMAIAFVLAMLSLPIFATYLVARVIRSPKQPAESEDETSKLINVLNLMVGKLETLNQVVENVEGLTLTTSMLIDSVKELASQIVSQDTKSTEDRETIAAINAGQQETTEQVTTMNGDIDEIKTIVETLAKDMATVLERLDELTKEAETPTEPTTPIIDPGEPSIGKIGVIAPPETTEPKLKTIPIGKEAKP